MIKKYIPFLLLLLAGILFYAPSFPNGFTYDDKMVLVNNHYVQDIDNLPRLFGSDYFLVSSERTFRPVAPLTLFFEHFLFGLNPYPYHLLNFLIHFANACLLVILLVRLKHTDLSAFLVGLLFFLNPALSETVFCMSYMEDLWGFLFYMIGILVFLKYLNSEKICYVLAAQALFFISLLSKEMGISYIAVLPLLMRTYYKQNIFRPKYLKTVLLPSIITSTVYLWLRFFVYYQQSKSADYLTGGFLSTVINIPRIFLFYVKLLLYPIGLVADYDFKLYDSILEGSVVFCLIVTVLILGLLFRLRRKNLFWGLFFLINFVPVSNIIPFGAVVAERYIYFSCAGFAVLIGLAFAGQMRINKRITVAVFGLLILSYGVVLMHRGLDWRSDESLWLANSRKLPACAGKATYHVNLGNVYFRRGDYDRALKEYFTARSIDPDVAGVYTNMGVIYMNQGHYELPKSLFLKVVSLRKKSPEGYYRLSVLYEKQGKYDRAEQMICKSLDFDDTSLRGLFQWARVCVKSGQTAKSIECYRRILSIDKKNRQAYIALAWVYVDTGAYDKAHETLSEGLSELPNDGYLRVVLAQVLFSEKKYLDALAELDKVISLDSDNKMAYPIRASIFYKMGKFGLAESDLIESIRLNPGEVKYLNNLASIYADAGKFDKAKQLWRKSLSLRPDQPRIKKYLAE